MYRLARPAVELYALTGDHMNNDLQRALKGLWVSDEALAKHRSRMNAVFSGEDKEFIPVSADIRWWIIENWHDGTLEKELSSCDLDRVLLSIGKSRQDYHENNLKEEFAPIPDIIEEEIWSGIPIKYVNGGYPGSKRTILVKTPVGSVSASEEYASRSFGITEYPVKTIEDLRVIRYIYEQRAKFCNTNTVTDFCAPMTPIQILLVQLAGIENTVYMISDHRDEVEEFMHFLEEIHKPVVEYKAKRGKNVFSVENYSSEVSSGYYELYLAPQLKRRSKLIEKYGAFIGVHHDGKLFPLLGKLKECGVRYINGITAAPSGDLEPERIREVAGEGVILADIFPQSIFMHQYREQDFIDYVKRVAEFYKNDNRIIFGIGDMLPCVGDIKRFEMMIRMVEDITKK